jgi:transposase
MAPYSPELNPTEQIWKMLRGKYFGNITLETLDETMVQAKAGLRNMVKNPDGLIKLTNWPWINTILEPF